VCPSCDSHSASVCSVGQKPGLEPVWVRFYDCCGALAEDAPGCCTGPHASFDED